jgi:clathrin heavy chain
MNLIENWIKEGKLTMTDELGDLIRQANPQMALSIYQQSGSPDKVIQGLIETNQLDKIMPYCQQTGHVPDFVKILRQIMPINPQAAVNLAKMVTNRDQGPPKANIDQCVNAFLEFNKIQECTAFLLEALKGNRPDEGHLQTKVLEINLINAPNVAEGIFKLDLFTQYDREKVAKMCEQVGLYGRALQNYTNMVDIKRVMLNTHAIPEEQIIEFFGRLGEDDSLQCMYDMLKSNRQNVQLVAKIAVKYANKIDTKKSIEVLESFGTNEGMLYYLANVLPHTEDPDIYFKYIEACARLGNYKEVERVIRETSNYDAEKVKDFLKESKLPDPRPLIYLCDQHGFTDELTRYLYSNKQNKFIEIYLFKVNPNATPKVTGTLLELDCDEIYIKQLLNSIRVCPIPELVQEFEERGKLRML